MEAYRPETWDEFVGQPKLKERLETHCNAALISGEPLGHLLLTGPPGVGKTTVGNLVAKKLDQKLVSFVMPVKSEQLRKTIRIHRGILFLDELHRLPPKRQEELLPLLEDGYLQLDNGGVIFAPFLTVVGATTEPENIIPPLYDRFSLKPLFEPYTIGQMARMIRGMARKAGIEVTPVQANELALASCGNPRNARQLVTAARSLVLSEGRFTSERVMALAGLTKDGLSEQHVEYLRVLDAVGGRAGLTPIATMMRLHPRVVTELERTLIDKELITYGLKGRELSAGAYDLIGGI